MMIGAVIVAHGALAAGLKDAAEAICGKAAGLAAVSVGVGDLPEAVMERLKDAIKACDSGRGVVVFTDMLGGTPSNVALPHLGDNVDVLTGVNLPMVIKYLSRREKEDMPKLVATLMKCGRENIVQAGDMLKPGKQAT